MIKARSLLLFAQALMVCIEMNAQLTILRDNGTGNPITANPYLEVKGSQYLHDFRPGIIYLPDGQAVEGLPIALNGYENTLEYKIGDRLYAYSPEKLKGFSYVSESGEKIVFTSAFTVPTLSKRRFLQVLENEGAYQLLLHTYKIMANDVTAAYGAQSAKVFQNQEEFFVVKDANVFLLKNKQKDLQAIFGGDFEKASALIGDQKINFKDKDAVKSLIRQMNQ
ncbi:MAG: hypothetical protein ACOYOO_01740 [Saprospiraceae bacterium]|jgi:hypothetical protein